MNIFYLNKNPKLCAEQHVDKHVVKMILEYAQLLSTAHRTLDGEEYLAKTENGRNIKRWKLDNPELENILFKASHVNHPSGIWCRKNSTTYMWLAELLEWTCAEYTHRYGKTHSVERTGLMQILKNNFPNNMLDGEFSEPTPAMPDECKVAGNSLQSYHNYYIMKKNHFAKWTKRDIPEWYVV
jgi:hypothetical protein